MGTDTGGALGTRCATWHRGPVSSRAFSVHRALVQFTPPYRSSPCCSRAKVTRLRRAHQDAGLALHRGKRRLRRWRRLVDEDALGAAVYLVGLLRAVADGGHAGSPELGERAHHVEDDADLAGGG